MSMNRKEAIKRTALLMGGCAFVPGALGVLKGCTTSSLDDISGARDGAPIDEDTIAINNVTALRSTPGTDGDAAVLTGYFEHDDGGGSEVYWDGSSTEDDDNGMVFKVDGISTGRWKRPDVGFINVKWFGARGDGIFRSGRDNELPVFDHCLEWIKNHEIKKLYIPKGLYILQHGLRTQINSAYNGLEIYGDGPESELRFPDNANDISDVTQRLWMIRWESSASGDNYLENIYIHDLKLNGNRQKHGIAHNVATGYGIWIGGSNLPKGEESRNIKIERVHTLNHTTSGFSLRTSNMLVKDCYSEGHILHGFETRDDPKNITVEGYAAYKCGDGRGYGFDFSSGDNLKINNFKIDECQSGMKVSVGVQSLLMTNGHIKDCSERAIDQSGTPHPDFTMKIDNLVTENNGGAARFNIAKSITISNYTSRNDGGGNEAFWVDNDIEEFNTENLSIYNASGRAMRLFAKNASMKNLVIDGASSEGIQSSSSGNNVTITGGKLENISGACIRARGSSSYTLNSIEFHGGTAIHADSGSVVEVTDCDFSGISTNNTGSGTVSYKGKNKI